MDQATTSPLHGIMRGETHNGPSTFMDTCWGDDSMQRSHQVRDIAGGGVYLIEDLDALGVSLKRTLPDLNKQNARCGCACFNLIIHVNIIEEPCVNRCPYRSRRVPCSSMMQHESHLRTQNSYIIICIQFYAHRHRYTPTKSSIQMS
jgi:hypothetical protein